MAVGALVALTMAGGPSTAQTERLEPLTAERAQQLVADVAPEVERLRGLAFERPVAVSLVDSEGARDYMLGRLATFQAVEDFSALEQVYEALGLLPGNLRMLDMLLDTLAEQAGAYYDPESGGYFVMRDLAPRAAPAVSAHELTHALEDQHFDLDGRLRGALHDEDRLFALSAVHEGSANLLMAAFLRERVTSGLSEAGELRALDPSVLARSESLAALPPILLRQIVGPYVLGAEFLAGTGQDSDFPASRVDRAYADPPLSSEQILHPDKYWDAEARDDPRPVDLDDAGRALGERWSRRSQGQLGELGLAVLVGADTPLAEAPTPALGERWTHPAAAGWDGDRWELWVRGKSAVVLLCTVWDSPGDAAEFAEALPEGRGIHRVVERDGVVLVAGDVKPKAAQRLLEGLRAACAAMAESVE